jgi:hypothetical protein
MISGSDVIGVLTAVTFKHGQRFGSAAGGIKTLEVDLARMHPECLARALLGHPTSLVAHQSADLVGRARSPPWLARWRPP